MDPQTVQPAQQAPIQAPTPAPQPSPLFAETCFYMPAGASTIFSVRKVQVYIYPGWLIAQDVQTAQELQRVQLGPDLQLGGMAGYVRFAQINGQKYGLFSRQPIYYFYDPRLFLLTYLVVLFGGAKRKRFIQACKAAAGLPQ